MKTMEKMNSLDVLDISEIRNVRRSGGDTDRLQMGFLAQNP